MITSLDWESLESRRKKADLLMLYKVKNNLVSIPSQYHPLETNRATRCNHNQKLCHIRASTDLYKCSLFPRTVPLWNQQSANLIEQESIDDFKCVLKSLSF